MAVLLTLCFSLSAEEPEPLPVWAAGLPEVTARIDGRTVSRRDAVRLLRRHGGDPAPGELRLRLRQALEEEACRIAVERKLAAAGIRPDRAETRRQLLRARNLLPPELRAADDTALNRLADDGEVRLRIGVQRLLAAEAAAAPVVDAARIEDYYRAHQDAFRRPAVDELEVVAAAATPAGRRELERAAALLRQGAPAETARREIRATAAGAMPEAVLRRAAAELPEGGVSAVLETDGTAGVVRVRRRRPAGYYPLAAVSGYIREVLEAERAAAELRRLISGALAEMRIEFFF